MMIKTAYKQIWPAFALLCILSILLGLIYPGIITLFLHFTFPEKANGSLILYNEHVIGSELIGQSFTDPKYFWSRPSATIPPYNAKDSKGSNLNPANPQLIENIHKITHQLRQYDESNNNLIPIDLVTTSASGLDPHITIASALFQIPRIAKARRMDENVVHEILLSVIERRQWGILGEPRVNVVKLNLKLDEEQQKQNGTAKA